MSKNNNNNEEKLSAKEKREIIKRTLKAVRVADSGYLIRDTIEYVLGLATEFVFIYLSALVIDGITQSKPVGTLLSYAAIVVGVQAVIFMTKMFLFRRSSSQTFARSTNLHKNLWQKVMTMDFVRLENTDTQNRFSNADNQVENNNAGIPALCKYVIYSIGGLFLIITGVILIIPMVFVKPVTTAGFSGFIQSIWGFLAVVIITVLLEMLKSLVINPKAILGFEKLQNDKKVIQANRADGFFSNYILRNYRNGKEIRIYSQQNLIDKELDKARDEIAEGWFKAYKSAMLPNFLCQVVNILTKALMYGFAVMRAASGMLSPGEVIAFALYFEKISAGVSDLSDFYGLLKITPTFCKKYFDFLDIPDEKYKGTIPTEKRDDNEYEFEFKHVWFKYPDSEEYTLKDINLKWRIGEKMALVGKNGIETCLYKDFDENGVEISGGEAQKLCLARAIYKGSPFIVLDEPTAALDPISEYDIYTKFNSIVGTRTAIYISHRLSSCRFCDDITVLDNGHIIERGSHEKLIAKGGIYTAMWAAQAEYYKDTAGELFA